MRLELTDLSYETDALEPYISVKNIEYHYYTLQKDYITSLNSLLPTSKYRNLDLETIIKIAEGPVYNYAAQVWNHTFYFEGLRPGKEINTNIKRTFINVLKNSFGSVQFFKRTFFKAAGSEFVSGWIWLVLTHKGTLEILREDQTGNPLRTGYIPLLNCDIWEHAYYIDYQNRRKEYLDSFWNLINWDVISKRYFDAK